MISVEDYFHGRPHSDEHEANATKLVGLVNTLLMKYEVATGRTVPVNPLTGCQIAGSKEGGFRFQDCPQGSPLSSHKIGAGVDVFDPKNQLDVWITDDILEECDLYREHPSATNSWCHLTFRSPPSGHRSFFP